MYFFLVKALSRLDMLPLAVGIGGAAIGAALTPILAPAGLSLLGFGAAGPVVGKSCPSPFIDPPAAQENKAVVLIN